MAAFSSHLTAGSALVGPTSKGLLYRDPIPIMPVSSLPSSPVMKMPNKGVAAVATASREPVASHAPNLFPIYRDRSSAAAAAVFDYKKIDDEEENGRTRDSVTADQMDRWVRESIGEIVRNIGEAPLLVQIFSQGPSVPRLEREEASPERWPVVKKRWDQTSCTPDGVILVEELKDDDEEEDGIDDLNNDEANESRRWGLVVQGRGMDCAAPCYILNTCRVRSPAGFCTHFCLVRAKCFGETVDKQLGRAWLQGR